MNYTTTEYVNPYGTVPCLYVDGKGVFESPTICEFVEDKWPSRGTKLMPDGRRDCFFLPWACLPCPGSDIDRTNIPFRPPRPRRHPPAHLALQRADHPPALPLVRDSALGGKKQSNRSSLAFQRNPIYRTTIIYNTVSRPKRPRRSG